MLNLWHGNGPKLGNPANFLTSLESSAYIASDEIWGAKKPRRFGSANSKLIVTPNPRTRYFAEPLRDSELEDLDMDSKLPYILWLPTWRPDPWVMSGHPSLEGTGANLGVFERKLQ